MIKIDLTIDDVKSILLSHIIDSVQLQIHKLDTEIMKKTRLQAEQLKDVIIPTEADLLISEVDGSKKIRILWKRQTYDLESVPTSLLPLIHDLEQLTKDYDELVMFNDMIIDKADWSFVEDAIKDVVPRFHKLLGNLICEWNTGNED